MNDALFGILSLAIPLVLIGLELTSKDYRDVTFRDPKRMARNWSYLLASVIVINCVKHLNLWMVPHLPVLHSIELPLWLDIVGCIFFAEFLNYGLHYAKHKSEFLWKFHFQHHIESKYNIWLVTHTHGLEVMISGTFLATLCTVAGFSPLALSVFLLIYNGVKTYQHSTHNYSLGWLDHIIINPAMHRLHHAIGMDVNFGSMLTVYDHLFGTIAFPDDVSEEDIVLGIEDHGEPFGFTKEMLYFLKPTREV